MNRMMEKGVFVRIVSVVMAVTIVISLVSVRTVEAKENHRGGVWKKQNAPVLTQRQEIRLALWNRRLVDAVFEDSVWQEKYHERAERKRGRSSRGTETVLDEEERETVILVLRDVYADDWGDWDDEDDEEEEKDAYIVSGHIYAADKSGIKHEEINFVRKDTDMCRKCRTSGNGAYRVKLLEGTYDIVWEEQVLGSVTVAGKEVTRNIQTDIVKVSGKVRHHGVTDVRYIRIGRYYGWFSFHTGGKYKLYALPGTYSVYAGDSDVAIGEVTVEGEHQTLNFDIGSIRLY